MSFKGNDLAFLIFRFNNHFLDQIWRASTAYCKLLPMVSSSVKICQHNLASSTKHKLFCKYHRLLNKLLNSLFFLVFNVICCCCCAILVWVFCMLYLRHQTGLHHRLCLSLVQNGHYLSVLAHTGECLVTDGR